MGDGAAQLSLQHSGQEQENHKLKASLPYMVRPCLTKPQQRMSELRDDQPWG